MKHIILFPSDYFDTKQIDETYLPEYNEVCKLPEFDILLYNHDMLVNENTLRFYPRPDEFHGSVCVGRTWMLQPSEYGKLHNRLISHGVTLINPIQYYKTMHLFPLIYLDIKDFTPKTIIFEDINKIDADLINSEFKRFMIKDYVKSVKEHDFPKYFETPVTQVELRKYIDKFIEYRASLFTGGFVFKEYINLKRYGSAANEYRVFYLRGEILTISPNSNQPESCPYPPQHFVEKFKNLPSNYYTIDFAELEDGGFIIIETGDGQVSGLSPGQYIFKYYDEMRAMINKK